MFIRYSKEEFLTLTNSETPFILMVYYMNQGKRIEGTTKFYDSLAITPSFIEKYDEIRGSKIENHLTIFESVFPEIIIMESYHHEVYDILIDLGFDYEEMWKEKSKIYRPQILAFKGYRNYQSAYYKCYCIESLTELAIFTNPELFKPSSISES